MEDKQPEPGHEIVQAPPPHILQLFEAETPEQTIELATRVAVPLAKVIEDRGLFVQIRRSRHVYVEGWLLLGSMVRPSVHPHTVWTRRLAEPDDGWEAKVEARTITGHVISAAESMCGRDEDRWKDADSFSIRSMAQTRATSKALSQPLRFIMVLAGFEATPAEEMVGLDDAGQDRGGGNGRKRGSKGKVGEPDEWVANVIKAAGSEGKVIAAARKLVKEAGADLTIQKPVDMNPMPLPLRVLLIQRLDIEVDVGVDKAPPDEEDKPLEGEVVEPGKVDTPAGSSSWGGSSSWEEPGFPQS